MNAGPRFVTSKPAVRPSRQLHNFVGREVFRVAGCDAARSARDTPARYFCSLNVPTKIVRQRFPVTKNRPLALS